MRVERTALPGVLVIAPRVHADDRGWFFESFRDEVLERECGDRVRFRQENHSLSRRGVLRGLHYQLPPRPQGKLVRVTAGAVFDVAVDVRRGSATLGRWVGRRLDAAERLELWIPAGFAHGFLALTESAEVQYLATDIYAPECERAIRWDDPALAIEWPIDGAPLLSPKDAAAPSFAAAELFPAPEGM